MSDDRCGRAETQHNRYARSNEPELLNVPAVEPVVSNDGEASLEPVSRKPFDQDATQTQHHHNKIRNRQKRSKARPRPPHSKHRRGQTYAALDLGTNNCRLLVAVPRERGFRVIDAFSRIVRLGEGLHASGRLSDEAMDRALDALLMCAQKLENVKVDRMRLIATEACRQASNGEEFLERVKSRTGLSLEVVSRETEARLAASGCRSLIHPRARGAILFDIGGGSSEIAWIGRDHKNARRNKNTRGFSLKHSISIRTGVVTLAESHNCDYITPEVFDNMVAEAWDFIEQHPDSEPISEALKSGSFHMLGTSGTVTTLAGVHLGLERYDRRRIDGMWMKGKDIERMTRRIVDMSKNERLENPCIGRDRADLVLAGCAILQAIRRKWPCQSLRVADRGLREGILVELMDADGAWRPPSERYHRGKSRNERSSKEHAGPQPPSSSQTNTDNRS